MFLSTWGSIPRAEMFNKAVWHEDMDWLITHHT